jgi:outer membrane protein TolC
MRWLLSIISALRLLSWKHLELADETYRQLRTQYLNGVADYIEVLDTLTAQQVLARNLVTARLDLIEFRIALHRALAGGFYPTAEIEATQSTGR